VVIARNRADSYLSSLPEPADILLVIEVSDSTLKYAERTKLSLYTEAGISNYWIFYFVYNQLEMHSELAQKRQRDFNYRSQRVVMQNKAVVIPAFTDWSLDLSLVFPAWAELMI
jgi:CO dehydrogenase nickel-insertion accessory protein CooC1